MNAKALVIAVSGVATLAGGTVALTAIQTKQETYQEVQASGVEIVQMQNGEIIAEFPSLDDAEIISSYPADLILESINNGTPIDGFTFGKR